MPEDCYLHFECGACNSIFEVNTADYEDAAWLAAYRFLNAHVNCGMLLPADNVSYHVKQELGWEDLPPPPGEEPPDEGDGDEIIPVP